MSDICCMHGFQLLANSCLYKKYGLELLQNFDKVCIWCIILHNIFFVAIDGQYAGAGPQVVTHNVQDTKGQV